ncbi:MAG: dihydropteroate synthase [Nitrospirae bacterium RIFCSPHIGHO2_02_FULL_42_12]|nr:MAG: dihydropteroate synthase [Nitrospirae bacterium RIFCSPHIGHO2_02_FULL_42_12]
MQSQIKNQSSKIDLTFKDKTYLMGVINITPDSFSDGGLFFDPEKAFEHGLRLEAEGADILDIGGESTRPGAVPLPVEEEIRRVIPVIQSLSTRVKVPISIDTYKAEVARLAIEAGASIVNDISALRFDPEMVNIVKKYKIPVVLMHMLGRPSNMQVNPVYKDVVKEVYEFLRERIDYAVRNGIFKEKIIIDPGIGFGKRLNDNILLIRHLEVFKELSCPVLIGPSRKSFIGEILNLPVKERFHGTAAVAAIAIMKGVNIIRVHDVKEMKQLAKMADSIRGE